jgi:transcriptional regulator with XRE-family HTH domain
MTTFGERLRQLRQDAGVTQQELARRSGVNYYTLRNYEQDRRDPFWRNVFDLAGGLGVSAEVFKDCRPAPGAQGRAPGRPSKPREDGAPKKRRPRKG